MRDNDHRPVMRGHSYVCADCGAFLLDVRTSARLRSLEDVDPVLLAAVEQRYLFDPKLAKRLVDEDPREVVSTYKLADKLHDFLRNPKARPDLQTPEAQQFLNILESYHNHKTDALMPWLAREWKKSRMRPHPYMPGNIHIQFDGGPDYEENGETFHTLSPEELEHWADWYRSDHPSRQGQDIMKLTAPELHQTIKDWDQDMRDKAQGSAQLRGDIEHSWPDGWTVQKLTTPQQLKDEGDKMGHCVGRYANDVESGRSLIYSLRDQHNEPHSTWEITPRLWKDPETGEMRDGDIHEEPGSVQALPQRGRMVQIQGKGNAPPIDAYQKRIKDYFEKTIPDPKDRPEWDEQFITELGEYERHHPEEHNPDDAIQYHPGDYGLEPPKMDFDWHSILNEAAENWHPDYYRDHAIGVANMAQENGQLEQLAAEKSRWMAEKEREHKETYEVENEPELERMRAEYAEHTPSPDFNDPDSPYEAWEDERERQVNQQAQTKQMAQRNWDHSNTAEYAYSLETALHSAQLQAGMNQQPTSKVGSIPTCEACGDLLEHGKCKRCDWGGWSNAMGDGDQNPQDPTKEMKPAIQS